MTGIDELAEKGMRELKAQRARAKYRGPKPEGLVRLHAQKKEALKINHGDPRDQIVLDSSLAGVSPPKPVTRQGSRIGLPRGGGESEQ